VCWRTGHVDTMKEKYKDGVGILEDMIIILWPDDVETTDNKDGEIKC